VVDEYNQFNQAMKKLHHFFNGNNQLFHYISLNSTFSEIPSLSQFECKENQLVYSEEPLYQRINVNQPVLLEESQTHVYWEDISSCAFSYMFKEKEVTQLNDELPWAVKISFVDSNEEEQTIFTTIKSDYNITHVEIHGLLYDE
jgi:hypothetical protein